MELIFATHNQHKTQEVLEILGGKWDVKNLHDLGCEEEIPETSDTLKGNALQKAQYVYEKYGVDCFADDTGLEVEALDGRPGVYSARYAGEHCSFADNVNKMLKEMDGKNNRKACFKTVIALILKGETYFFEGRVDGEILTAATGEAGFGYDPIFYVPEFGMTTAQMNPDQKNQISHRGKALRAMVEKLS